MVRGGIFMKTNAFLCLFLFLGLLSVFSFGDGIAGTLQDVKARGNGKRRGWILKNQIGSYGFGLRYLPYDEAYLNVGGDHVVNFLPNLLIADNDLKLVTVYSSTGRDDEVPQVKKEGGIISPNL
jgi:hypothetical protein